MSDSQDLPQNDDPRLERALRDLAAADSRQPDEITRRRHLNAMAAVRAGRRNSMVGVSAAAAAVVLVFAAVTVSRNGGTSGNERARNEAASAELPPLKEDPQLSPVPFERTEDYVILRVSADKAAGVATELSTALGGQPPVVGRTAKATTFVVPKSVAGTLTDTAGITAIPDTRMKSTEQQTNPPSWGLDRMDSPTEDYSYGYISAGAGKYVYVIDTGIYAANSDFGGRVVPGYDAVNDGNGTTDCNGHGTHVAGTIAGSKYGGAKSTTVVAVRVLDCTGAGYSSSVVAGINWVIASHPGGTGVINMSLGGGANAAVDQAVADATAAGLVVVVAAGNSGADACNYSPARAPSALTIGAVDRTTAKASFSNFGRCVDMWAPGTQITSDYIGGSSATATMSGTSMASPHVAGMVARLLQARPGISAAQITDTLTASSLSANPAGLPVVEFAESPDFATPTTTTTLDPGTTTTVDPATTTTVDPGTTTTTVAAPVTTLPGTTTTAPRATTTTVPRATTTTVSPRPTVPRTTVPGRGDDDDSKKPAPPTTPPTRSAPQPREFSLRYGEDANRGTLYAEWKEEGTPDSWKVECARMVTGSNAPVDTTILLAKSDVRSIEKDKRRAALTVVPAAGSRCWISSVAGSVTSPRSNPAILPPAEKREDPVRPPSTTTTTIPRTTTTTTIPRTTTTTVAPTTTTTIAPTTTTVAPTTTTVAPATTTTVAATSTRTVTTVKPVPPTVAQKKTVPEKDD